ncbi:MAG: ATP-binding protein [Pseudomonadota bacterium]
MALPSLFKPTLVRRVFLALLTAFLAIWITMMAVDLSINMGDDKTSRELSAISTYLADGLEQIDSAQAARAFLQGAVGEARRPDYNWRNFAAIRVALRERGGAVVLSNLAPGGATLAGAPGKIEALQIDGRRFLILRSETRRWVLHCALPLHTFAGILRDDWLDLTLNMLIAFPLTFLAVWIAITRGLLPLRQLSDRIGARGVDDLSPIDVDPRYAEIKPLVAALDTLLSRLRATLSRERAFVHDAAHELRTPMAVISAQAHVLSKADSARERAEAEQHMDGAIARAAHLVQQLLALAQLDASAGARGNEVDLARVLQQELAQLAPQALARGIELSLEAPPTLSHWLDLHAFRSIVHSLLENALRYVPRGGRVLVSLTAHALELRLSVADNGPGIAVEHRELVFERFYRIGGDSVPGSGLGLAIARQAAARLNGKLTLAPGLEGRGCRFELTLAMP